MTRRRSSMVLWYQVDTYLHTTKKDKEERAYANFVPTETSGTLFTSFHNLLFLVLNSLAQSWHLDYELLCIIQTMDTQMSNRGVVLVLHTIILSYLYICIRTRLRIFSQPDPILRSDFTYLGRSIWSIYL